MKKGNEIIINANYNNINKGLFSRKKKKRKKRRTTLNLYYMITTAITIRDHSLCQEKRKKRSNKLKLPKAKYVT